jgi:hypothetical protein
MSYEIQVLADRLSIVTPENTEYGIRWREIHRVHAYRLDGGKTSYRVVCFDFANGGYIEVNDSMPGFDRMLALLGAHVHLPPDYQQQVNATKCHEPPLTLYCRT